MKPRKLLSLFFAFVLLLSLAACQKENQAKPNTEPPKAQTDTQKPAEQPAPTPTPAPTEVVEISFWHSMDGVFAEIVDQQVTTFNDTIGKEKGIKVTPVFQNWPGTEALTAAMSTDDVKNMPDVIQLYSESVNLIQNYERTVWAEDYLAKGNSAFQKSDLIPNAVANYTINERMIGLPYTLSSLMLYYNQDYFKQIGMETAPKTIAEMAEIMPKLVEKTDAEFGLNVRVQLYELENWIATQGSDGSWFGNNNSGRSGAMTELAADKDGSLEKFLGEWQKVVDSGVYKATRDSINDEFAAGMHAMVIMSSSRIPTIKNLVGDAFQWNIAPIPTVSASDIGGCTPSGSGLFMLNRGEEKQTNAAWEFMQFMVSPEAQAMWLSGTGYIPVNTKTKELDAYKAAVAEDPRLQIPYETSLKSSTKMVQSFCPNSGTVDGVIKEAMIAFGNGEADKDKTYQAIVEGAAKAFEEYYRANPLK